VLEQATLERAGLARRLAASTYESLLLAAIVLIASFVLLAAPGMPGAPSAGQRLALPEPDARLLEFLVVFVACGVYCAGLWSNGRRSLPMQTWHLRLLRQGRAPGIERAVLRYVAWWIGPACALAAYAMLQPLGHGRWGAALLALNYAWALVDPDRQFLHDRIAGTRLVRVEGAG